MLTHSRFDDITHKHPSTSVGTNIKFSGGLSPQTIDKDIHILKTVNDPRTFPKDIISPHKSIQDNLTVMAASLTVLMSIIKNVHKKDVHFTEVKAQCLYLQREFIFISSQHDKMTDSEKRQYTHVLHLLDHIETYVHGRDRELMNAHMKILTYITAILTPLGVLVGYFGMNFSDMGAPSNGKGVFSFQHGHYIIFGLMLVIIAFMTFMYFYGVPS